MMSDRINVGSDSEEISSQDDQEDDDIYSDHFEQVIYIKYIKNYLCILLFLSRVKQRAL